MAIIPYTIIPANYEGTVYFWDAIPNDSEGMPVMFNDGQYECTVSAEGSPGGATVTMRGWIGGIWKVVDDAFGQAMSYTVLATGIIKPVGPSVLGLKPLVTGGVGTDIDVYLWVRRVAR